jgi:hypothetical protein
VKFPPRKPNGRLEDVVAAASWPTPTTRDHKSGLSSEATMESNARPLSEVATWATPQAFDANKCERSSEKLAEAKTKGGCSNLREQVKEGIGAAPSVSGASSTASKGALNPAFVCWLMGYPDGWLD